MSVPTRPPLAIDQPFSFTPRLPPCPSGKQRGKRGSYAPRRDRARDAAFVARWLCADGVPACAWWFGYLFIILILGAVCGLAGFRVPDHGATRRGHVLPALPSLLAKCGRAREPRKRNARKGRRPAAVWQGLKKELACFHCDHCHGWRYYCTY